MLIKISLRNLKIVFTIFVLLTSFENILAQSNFQILEGNSLNDAVYQNIKSGQPQFTGMDDLYIITTDNMKAASNEDMKDPSMDTKLAIDIKAIQGVLACSFDIPNSKVYVTFTKPDNKDYYSNDIHMANLKEVLAHNGMKMIAQKIVVIRK